MIRFTVDGRPIEARPRDSVLVAMLRARVEPTGGGCLCLAGDCPHCLVTLDGVAYTRSCQVEARAEMVVERDHLGGAEPPLRSAEATNRTPAPIRHRHCDTVVIGQGRAGRREVRKARTAGLDVVALDAGSGESVTGIYPGPLVVAGRREGVLHVHPRREIVVATGAAEIQPVAPGSGLPGLLTFRAASALVDAGIDLGRVAVLGEMPASLPESLADGRLVAHFPTGEDGFDLLRFEGDDRLERLVVRAHGQPDAPERQVACDTAVVALGRWPRNALARMATDLPVRIVGSAAHEAPPPSCPREGTICPCSGVTVADLDDVWRRGFREMELLKRATLAGTGACQGGACLPWMQSFLLDRGGRLQPAFTARPLSRQLTVRELAAGAHQFTTARSPLHDEHLRLGARMERAGGWWRPWNYGASDSTAAAEYQAVRDRVSLGDTSSLGKMLVAGPDALPLLERIVPSRVSTLAAGRSRYVVMLDERGYLLDDGILCRDDEDRFFVTSTSGGSGFFELWLRDWAESYGFDVRILNRTASLAAINVTGPLAAELLARVGVPPDELPSWSRHRRLRIAGVECRVLRMSFTGELSYELHHPAAEAAGLWRRLLEAGADLGVQPHGLETLQRLRLEKGHILIGQDSDYDSTPRRLGLEWAVDLNKGDFVGRQAILRTNREPLDRRLVPLEIAFDGASDRDGANAAGADGSHGYRRSLEGTAVFRGDRYAGFVTSAVPATLAAATSRLDRPAIPLLAWIDLDERGELPDELTIDGRPARRLEGAAYDPRGKRARARVDAAGARADGANANARPRASAPAGGKPTDTNLLQTFEATRVAASATAIDDLLKLRPWPEEALGLRVAPDELLVCAAGPIEVAGDPHALAVRETGFCGLWLSGDDAASLLARECEWAPPAERPAFAQGEVAGIPAKLWFDERRVFLFIASALRAPFERRLRRALGRDAEAARA